MSWFSRLHDRIDVSTGYAAAFTIVVLMLLNSGDVLGRFLFNSPIPSTYEFSEVMLAVIVFLAIPFVQYRKDHISITILSDRYPKRFKKIFETACLLLSTAVYLLIAKQGWTLFMSSLEIAEYSEGRIAFYIFPFKLVALVGMIVLTLRALSQLIASIRDPVE